MTTKFVCPARHPPLVEYLSDADIHALKKDNHAIMSERRRDRALASASANLASSENFAPLRKTRETKTYSSEHVSTIPSSAPERPRRIK